MAGVRPVLLAAGGTGGHLFPAEALATELGKRDVPVELVTDPRARDYAITFPARAIHAVSSATFGSRNPVDIFRSASKLGLGFGESARLLRTIRPSVVVGFGGYPSIPPLGAAQLLKFPTIVHEQNAVLGRANRVLARRATRVATGFPTLAKATDEILAKGAHVGNPVREAVLKAADTTYYPPRPDGFVRLLVFGGSQGARVMAEIVPAAMKWLEPELHPHLVIVQQARSEDIEAVSGIYASAKIQAEVAPFFRDLPARMAEAHLVIARSGASTVAELAVIGRPSILVPLPHSLDNDQLENARSLASVGGTTVVPQSEFTPQVLARLLTDLMAKPQTLATQAAAARSYGKPDAAVRLADLVLEVARVHS